MDISRDIIIIFTVHKFPYYGYLKKMKFLLYKENMNKEIY